MLADAALRLDKLGAASGVLFVEGEDDRRLLADRIVPAEQLIVGGGKSRVLRACAARESEEEGAYLFLVDCDFDVPAGRLKPGGDLIVTHMPSIESDLVAAGALRGVVRELVPRARLQGTVASTARIVECRAVALAEGLGRLRYAARVLDLPLSFESLRANVRKYRKADGPDVEKMLQVLRSQPEQPDFDTDELRTLAESAQSGIQLCDGHDLVSAIATVLRDDFSVEARAAITLPSLLRLSITTEALLESPVGKRLRRWEVRTGRSVIHAAG